MVKNYNKKNRFVGTSVGALTGFLVSFYSLTSTTTRNSVSSPIYSLIRDTIFGGGVGMLSDLVITSIALIIALKLRML